MVIILILKWLFVLGAIVLSIYHYKLEKDKITLISKHISDNKIISQLRSSARTRMGHFLIFFMAFIFWIMSYDLEIETISKQRSELLQELKKSSDKQGDLSNTQRLIYANNTASHDVINDVKDYYSGIFVNYYVMRTCNMAENDDIFIINSALMREISLNNIPVTVRDDIINDAKIQYSKKYSNFKCDQIYGNFNSIIKNYKNYIITTRETLKAIF